MAIVFALPPSGLEHITVPVGIRTLEDFRSWTQEPDFPEKGRIEFIDGNVEVDMTANRIKTHDLILSEVSAKLVVWLQDQNLGQILGENIRMIGVVAKAAVQPDLKFITWQSLRNGRVTPVLAKDPIDDTDYFEIEGPPEMVLEVVSPSSKHKDYKRLPAAYFNIGVDEYWLIDAVELETPRFVIHKRGAATFEAVAPESDGYVASKILNAAFKLDCHEGVVAGFPQYRFQIRPL